MGTDHVGTGYCYFHDEDTISVAGRHLPLLQMLDPELRPLVVRMIEDDQDLFDLRFELGVMRARFAREHEEMTIANFVKMFRSIYYGASTLKEMEEGKHYYVHINTLSLVLEAVGVVSRQYIHGADADSFARDLENTMKTVLPKTTTQGIAASALVERIEG
jgi:hypothetical protein